MTDDILAVQSKLWDIADNLRANVNAVDKGRLGNDPRFPFEPPSADNANYLWVQMFYAALNERDAERTKRGNWSFVVVTDRADLDEQEQAIRRHFDREYHLITRDEGLSEEELAILGLLLESPRQS
ncbi:MAG: hypothetical protein ACYCZY_01905 [Lacisediminihabitans sp.]